MMIRRLQFTVTILREILMDFLSKSRTTSEKMSALYSFCVHNAAVNGEAVKSNRRRNKTGNAYLTVEAAMIFPMILIMQLFIIFLFVFQYDRCLLDQDMGRLVVSGCSAEEQEKDKLADYLRKCSGELYREKYVAWEFGSIELTLEKNKICAEGKGTLLVPVLENNVWSGSKWDAEATCEMKRLQPVVLIRQSRKWKGEK